MLGFFVTFFLVDYESVNSILKIFFRGALEIKRFYDFTMYVVYFYALIFLFEVRYDSKTTLDEYLDLRGCYKSSSHTNGYLSDIISNFNN